MAPELATPKDFVYMHMGLQKFNPINTTIGDTIYTHSKNSEVLYSLIQSTMLQSSIYKPQVSEKRGARNAGLQNHVIKLEALKCRIGHVRERYCVLGRIVLIV